MPQNIPPEDLLPGVPRVESPLFDLFADRVFDDPTLRQLADSLHHQGFAVIDMPENDFDDLVDEIKRDLSRLYDWDGWRSGARKALRVQSAWRYHHGVRRLAANPVLMDWLSRLYGRRAFPFQTINFPVGTQQIAHSDEAHFCSIPERFLCGVWLALEDMDEENGALYYYPGSHRWGHLRNDHIGANQHYLRSPQDRHRRLAEVWERIAAAHGAERQVFRARKGQALIWAAGLLHGGLPVKDPGRTRWSQVTHYFFDDCGYTVPILNDVLQQSAHLLDVDDASTGEPVRNLLDPNRTPPLRKAVQLTDDSLTRIDVILARSVGPEVVPGLPPSFNAKTYLLKNADLLDLGVDPYLHFSQHGRRARREW